MIDDLYPLIIDVFQVALQTHFHTSSSKHSPFVLRVQAEVDFDWAQAVSDFRDRLRGDLTTEDLGPWGALGNP